MQAYMQNYPARVVQPPTNSHDEFHRDVAAQFKIDERGAVAVLEPRAWTGPTSRKRSGAGQ